MAQLYDLTGCLGNISASAGLMMQINPAVIESFQKLAAATGENMQWIMNMMGVNAQAEKRGFPIMKMTTGGGIAPFDDISNYMRGTKGILTDIYRRPEKVLEAMDFLIEMRIKRMKGGFMAFTQDYPFSHMALHKGGDDFMSDKQFATFYWPQLKKILLAIINEGYVPFIFAEGYFNRRLEYFTELPKGSVVWWFESTDIIRAKQILGNYACIAGGIPNQRFILDKPEDIKKKCREIIDFCGRGGGFILGCGGFGNIHNGKKENVLAMVQAAREYKV
jgi:uroporphyrinogen-III decarboxylase